jgi:DNA repair exonuclease SbcCD nuclease subunit
MAKIALICDVHTGIRNDNPIFQDSLRKSMKSFFDYIDKHNIKHIINLGDLYDRRKYINFVSAKLCREVFLEEIEKRKISTHIILGNHDVYYRDTNRVNALEELVRGRYSHIGIVDSPYEMNIDGCKMIMLPWLTKDNIDECMAAINDTEATVLFGHLELVGFQMHKGQIADHGMDKEIFTKFDRVFSGHYHHRSGIGNIVYLGAFGYYTWSDAGDYRGFAIFDTETLETEFIKNRYCPFKVIEYDETNPVKDFAEYENCYVKVVIKNRENLYTFDQFLDSLYESKPADISIVEDVSSFVEIEESGETDPNQDTKSILSNYIDGLSLPVDNKKMKTYMSDVYQEAISLEHV